MSDPGDGGRDDDGTGPGSGVGLVIGSRPPSLERRAYDAVLHWLLEGGASPGEVVPLRELSRRLGISRTPVRFAVGRLHEQGLVDYDARIGFTVSLPSVADLEELFDLRLMCEVHAVRRVFAHGAGSNRALGEALALEAREGSELAVRVATDPSLFPAFSERDSRFHRLVIDHAASPRLGGWYEQVSLRMVIFRLGWHVPLSRERFEVSAREHDAIAEAISSGDEQGATSLLERHIGRVRVQTIERAGLVRSDPGRDKRGSWMPASTIPAGRATNSQGITWRPDVPRSGELMPPLIAGRERIDDIE